MSEDLIDWLRAQLDDDERSVAAILRRHPNWRVDPEPWGSIQMGVIDDQCDGVAYALGSYAAEHIARHDPARVLREVEARRRLIDQYEAMRAGAEAAAGTILAGAAKVRLGAYEIAVRIMALPYSDHPDFREEWRPQ